MTGIGAGIALAGIWGAFAFVYVKRPDDDWSLVFFFAFLMTTIIASHL